MAKNGNLTARQQRAIEALLSARDVKAAAEACGVSYRTLRTWLQLPHFKQALQEAEAAVMAASVRRLATITAASVDQLSKLVDDDSKGVRLAAIRIVMTARPALKEETDFEERLRRLEDRANAKSTNPIG